MNDVLDYVIVGSGCSGAMAAQTLVEAGLKVTMLDVGFQNPNYKKMTPNKNYLDIRESEKNQHKYLIGEKGEGIVWGKVSKGAQVTPARYHMTKLIDKYIPLDSKSFMPLESLGYGGLGIGWGLQCWRFSEPDTLRAGLDPERMSAAYEVISKRIGISATKDAASPYTIGNLKEYMPSAKTDRNHTKINKLYTANERRFIKDGFYVGRTPLALITKDKDGRKAYQYRDMDFYDDNGLSAWRPWITVDRLRNNKNFTYKDSCLVIKFSEIDDVVTVEYINTVTDKTEALRCRKLILASGALGTARIVLRSKGNKKSRLPLLSNPHSYIPCIQPSMIGKGGERNKLSLGQLSYFSDKEGTDDNASVASSYSYQSLMMFRIINQVPFGYSFSRKILQLLMPAFVILIAQHPDHPSKQKYLTLTPSKDSLSGDHLKAVYQLSEEDEKKWGNREKDYVKRLRKLRIFGLKRIHPGHGSGIHYAGTVPFSATEEPLRSSPAGRLYGTNHVYIADSSGFNYLPAKGLTFSLMANAHIIAENLINGKR